MQEVVSYVLVLVSSALPKSKRSARGLNYTIVEDLHKCIDRHKNCRTRKGESQSDSSRHKEVTVLHAYGELRLGTQTKPGLIALSPAKADRVEESSATAASHTAEALPNLRPLPKRPSLCVSVLLRVLCSQACVQFAKWRCSRQ